MDMRGTTNRRAEMRLPTTHCLHVFLRKITLLFRAENRDGSQPHGISPRRYRGAVERIRFTDYPLIELAFVQHIQRRVVRVTNGSDSGIYRAALQPQIHLVI